MGKVLTNFRFADDIVLILESLGKIIEILQDLQNPIQEMELKKYFFEMKIMTNLVPSEQFQIMNNNRNSRQVRAPGP